MSWGTRHHAFSLIELVIVLVIIGVIAAIAVPRLSRGATNASATAVTADLVMLRKAIELYRAEHEGTFPTVNDFVSQMTMFSNADGDSFNATPDLANGIAFGPYLKAMPPLPVGVRKGSTGVAAADAAGIGWIYTEATGKIRANTMAAELDKDAVQYRTY